MQTLQQILCPRCQEFNDLQEEFCANCGLPLKQPAAPTTQITPPPAPAPPDTKSDLVPLLITLVSLFGAIWGFAAAGGLYPLVGFLTHPVVVICGIVFALIMTGLLLSERVLKEPPPRAMLSTHDVFVLSWTLAALLGVGMLLKKPLFEAMPAITRVQPMPDAPDGCRVEVWFAGRPGDELWRLTEFRKTGQKSITGVVLRRESGGSVHLQTTYHTDKGDCAIGKYHVTANGKEIDSAEGF